MSDGATEMMHDEQNKFSTGRIEFGYSPVGNNLSLSRSALDTQVGGNHYKDLKIQPVEYITANNIGFLAGNVIKYVTRFGSKNGVQDLQKARHYIDLLIEFESKK